MARSNSAEDPTICIIIRAAGVVGSIALVRLRKFHFRLGKALHENHKQITLAELIEEAMEFWPAPDASSR